MGKKSNKKKKKRTAGNQPKHQSANVVKAVAEKKVQTPEVEAKPVSIIDDFRNSVKNSFKSFKENIDPEKLEKIKTLSKDFGKNSKTLLKKGGILMTSIVALSAILLVIDIYTDNRVLPNTKVGGIEVGYMDSEDAKSKILVAVNQYLKTPINFTYKENSFSFTPEELGIKFSPNQTFLSIPIADFKETNSLLHLTSHLSENDIPLQYVVDGEVATRQLESHFELTDKRAINAHFILVDGNFEIEPEKSGIAINRDKLVNELKNNFDSLGNSDITLYLEEEYPRITATNLEKEKDRLIALIDKPITLKYDGQSTTLNLRDHLGAIHYKEKTNLNLDDQSTSIPLIIDDKKITLNNENVSISSNLQLEVKQENIIEHLENEILNNIEIPTEGVKIFRDEEGKIIIEGEGRDGKFIPKNRLIQSINLAANNGISEVEIPVLVETAPVDVSEDLKNLGIKELVAVGHSAYYGSPPNRKFNINLGTSRYNGVIIAPGEEFSFNRYLGKVDARSGYLPEKIIKKNKLEVEYGGGICQVSTTIYRAALLAGLPITERNPHSWKVNYYGQSMGHGLDATIYPGVSDVKFINDTPGHLIIQSYTKSAEAYFKFYGTKDERSVEMIGPIGGGLHYKWLRILTKDGEAVEEPIISNYRPIPPPEPPPEEKKETPEEKPPPPESTI